MAITKTAKNMIQLGAGGSYSTARDAIRHQVWDTRYFAATPSDSTYFSQPVGAGWTPAGATKTKNETNLLDSGKLPNGQTFLITRMGVSLMSHYEVGLTTATTWPNASLIAQAYTNVMQCSVFEIRIAGREYDFQVHGRQFLPALSINGYNAGTAGSVARVGDTIVSGWIKLDPSPIFLDELVSFNVTQLVNNADTTNINLAGKPLYNSTLWLNAYHCTMQVTLEGFLTRAK
jgi:hypothetical protein